MLAMAKREGNPVATEWRKIILVWLAAVAAIAGAYVIYERGKHNRTVEEQQVAATRAMHEANRERARTRQAVERASQERQQARLGRQRARTEAARLRDGERCMGRRFARQIEGDPKRWESDPAQDWKCGTAARVR